MKHTIESCLEEVNKVYCLRDYYGSCLCKKFQILKSRDQTNAVKKNMDQLDIYDHWSYRLVNDVKLWSEDHNDPESWRFDTSLIKNKIKIPMTE